jgi:hypothetical protein
MTFATRAVELFLQRPPGVNRIDWLANQLLALATESHYLHLRIISDEGADSLTFECADSTNVHRTSDSSPLRLFRTLLARFAKMAEEENGAEFSPYGGKLNFDRNGPAGQVKVAVEFVNSGNAPSLCMTLLA